MTITTQKTVLYVGHIEHLPRHFCFESQGCFVSGNNAQRHANKGIQQIAEHRLEGSDSSTTRQLRQIFVCNQFSGLIKKCKNTGRLELSH